MESGSRNPVPSTGFQAPPKIKVNPRLSGVKAQVQPPQSDRRLHSPSECAQAVGGWPHEPETQLRDVLLESGRFGSGLSMAWPQAAPNC